MTFQSSWTQTVILTSVKLLSIEQHSGWFYTQTSSIPILAVQVPSNVTVGNRSVPQSLHV